MRLYKVNIPCHQKLDSSGHWLLVATVFTSGMALSITASI